MSIIINFLKNVYTTVTNNYSNFLKENSSIVETNYFSQKQIISEPNIVYYNQNCSILPNLDINSLFKESKSTSTNILYNQQSSNTNPLLVNDIKTDLDYETQSLIKTELIRENIFCDEDDNLETQIKIFENILRQYQQNDLNNLKSIDLKEENVVPRMFQANLSNDEMLILTEEYIKKKLLEEHKIESTIKHLNSNIENESNIPCQNSYIQNIILNITKKCIHLLILQINFLKKPQINLKKVKTISSQLYSF
ncbi:hypothetical protein NUSPORA_01259 [Nucleospora cyclopteri]